MKQKVLEMLKDFMMGREGSKFKPKEIHVEMMTAPKVVGKEGLADVLKDASEAAPVDCEDDESEIDPEDLDDEEKKPKKMTLRDFLESR